MINDNFGTSRNILRHIGKGYFYRNVSRHARARKDLYPDKWRKPVSENGATRNNYAAPEIREAGQQEEKHRRSRRVQSFEKLKSSVAVSPLYRHSDSLTNERDEKENGIYTKDGDATSFVLLMGEQSRPPENFLSYLW